MTKKTVLLASVAVSLLVLAGCSNVVGKTQSGASTSSPTQNRNTTPRVVKEESAQIFTEYTEERYLELLGKKPFVLFFHASWCSTCVQLTKDIEENLANFPKGTVILEADFDTETKLKQDYGVLMQATLVVIDKTGKVAQTLAAPSVEDLKTAIAQTL